MRIGISLASAQPGKRDAEVAGDLVERARAAARAGLSSLTLGDHHGTGPMPYLQNVPMLGRLLAEWDDRPVGCLFLVPAWNPVLMAEQIGTLAAIATGPFIVQTGLGTRRQVEVMGHRVEHRGRHLDSSLAVVKALLAGEIVSNEELGLRGVSIAPRPPHGVEWWIGAGVAPAFERAARLGDAWYADHGLTPETAREQMEGYLAACERLGVTPGRRILRKDVFIADDDATATSVGQALIDSGYRGMDSADYVAFGDPAHVAEQFSVFGEIGFTDIVIRTMTVPQPDAVRSIELAGTVADMVTGL